MTTESNQATNEHTRDSDGWLYWLGFGSPACLVAAAFPFNWGYEIFGTIMLIAFVPTVMFTYPAILVALQNVGERLFNKGSN